MTSPSDLLALALLAGLAAGGLASLVRVGARSITPAWADRKPIGCNACLGAWSAMAVVPVAGWVTGATVALSVAVLVWFASSAVAASVVAFVAPPPLELPGGES